MTSPKVFFNCEFSYALNNIDNRGNNNQQKRIIRKINGMFDYYSNNEKRIINMFDYYTGNINKDDSVNLVLENGCYATNEIIDKRKKQYTEYIKNSNLWRGLISFNNDYIDENIEIKDLEQKMVKEIIPRFLINCGFKDIKKMSYQTALHSDTDNYHFHFSFIEKEPNYINSKNKVSYRRFGKLKKTEIDFLKDQTVLAIERDKYFTPLLKDVNQNIDDLKKYFKPSEKNFVLKDKKDLILEENILRLGQMLYNYRINKDLSNKKIKYNSIFDNEIKLLTKNIKNYLFKDKDSLLYGQQEAVKLQLEKINSYLNSLSDQNNFKKSKSKNELVIKKEEYINNYIYNSIVNSACYKYGRLLKKGKPLKVDTVIQEAVLKQYMKNNKESRLTILKNYLSNTNSNMKFKNRYKIEQAIKNINLEMEEAQEKFHNLFKSNSYYNEKQ